MSFFDDDLAAFYTPGEFAVRATRVRDGEADLPLAVIPGGRSEESLQGYASFTEYAVTFPRADVQAGDQLVFDEDTPEAPNPVPWEVGPAFTVKAVQRINDGREMAVSLEPIEA